MDVATDFSSVLCDVNTIIEEKKSHFPNGSNPHLMIDDFDMWALHSKMNVSLQPILKDWEDNK